MTIEAAVKKACDDGYEPIWRGDDGQYIASKYPGEIFLDPSFWQSLGKAMGGVECASMKTMERQNGLTLLDVHGAASG